MLTDTRILGRVGAYEVQAQRYELMLFDGSSRWLHLVGRPHSGSADDMFLRAVQDPAGAPTFAVVDVRRLCRSLTESLPDASPRDRPGHVYYALRHKYAGALQFGLAVGDARLAYGEPMAAEVAA